MHRSRLFLFAGRYLALMLIGAVVLAFYALLVSAGRWTAWPPTTYYYDRLAVALRAGHLYVEANPPPGLLALSNPYEPDASSAVPGVRPEYPGTIWDMSLYQGKIYLYWGPAPALLIAALKQFSATPIGDHQLTFTFLFGSFLFQALLLERIWRRFLRSSRVPWWTLVGAILLTGFLNPGPWMLGSPRIYEAAIAAGQFFLMAGLFFVLMALDRPFPSKLLLALTAICWACAVASRAPLALPVALLGAMVMIWLFRANAGAPTPGSMLGPAAAFALTLFFGAALVAWYNWARFESIFEFGFRYAITMLDQNKYHMVLFLPAYMGPNASLYLFARPAWDSVFPFVRPLWDQELVSGFNARFHLIYNSERIVGLVFSSPFLFYALLPAALLSADSLRLWSRRNHDSSPIASSPEDLFLRWFILTLSASALLELLTVFVVFYGTLRYLMDATPTLALLSMIGFWMGWQRLPNNRSSRLVFALVAAALLLITVCMGVLLGFASNIPRLRLENPALLNHLRIFFISLARHLPR